jgi:hypothetical protein
LIHNPRLNATTLQTVGAKSYDGFTFIVVNPELAPSALED